MHDLVKWARAQVDEDEATTRGLLAEAQRVSLTLQDPRLLGREIPGWYSWPKVERTCIARLAEVDAKRRILDPAQADRAVRDDDLHALRSHRWSSPTGPATATSGARRCSMASDPKVELRQLLAEKLLARWVQAAHDDYIDPPFEGQCERIAGWLVDMFTVEEDYQSIEDQRLADPAPTATWHRRLVAATDWQPTPSQEAQR